MTPAPVEAKELAAVYGPHEVFAGISFDLEAGQLAALVGSNGSGKTTLLHTLCGIHRQMTGEVLIAGRSLAAFSPRELARRVALVPQMTDVAFEVTVDETVSLGRYPWMGPIAPPTHEDREAVEAALDAMDLAFLRDRPLQTLSGGERQRVVLARALAQGTEILFLDEPVASLDLKYQQETYRRLRALASDRGLCVLVADHHLNLVAAACDRVLVLRDGRLWGDGPPAEIISEEMIWQVFGARMRVHTGPGGTPQCLWDVSAP